MPICEAFAQIEQRPNIYDVVHVKYFDEVLLFVHIGIKGIILFWISSTSNVLMNSLSL